MTFNPDFFRSGNKLLAAFIFLLLLAFPQMTCAQTLAFRDLYEKGTELSGQAKALDGHQVEMTGYMAPPLKAQATFFVLTKLPLTVCPFCDTEVDWPTDIVFVRTPALFEATSFNTPIRVRGRFETGFATDPETGFVSFIRIVDAVIEKM